MGDDEFAEAREGYWQDEVDVVIVRDEILNGGCAQGKGQG